MTAAPRWVRVSLGLVVVLLVMFVLAAVSTGHADIAEWPARAAIASVVALVFAVGERWKGP